MAVIEPKPAKRKGGWGVLTILLLAGTLPLHADRAEDVRAQISYVASALGNGNPSDALGPFDKSFKDYEKLRDYFQALVTGFEVTSEVEILDEQDEETETKLQVNWAITLANPRTALDSNGGAGERRSANVNVRLAPKKGKWKIIDFSPIEIFNPQGKQPGNR